ncbi:ribose transport system permease protein [Pseudoxanthobacter soli DSM 19599]|uniref:Autoinducer 2 import system permease protein LsrD n=1 Tax=Pseudoxanthobacter soli DSM 19599 TaxID=1123029 RepID=A0A1M7ZLY0_9HYPH|nr:ABC transporter permease [Pseudoxanthobacter soli]SHO65908.1 ribose transport system permease protein [Pseudoxanthobacter soli DSM 19599]
MTILSSHAAEGLLGRAAVSTRRCLAGPAPLLMALIALCLLLGLTKPQFATYNNLYSVLYGVSLNAFAVLGFTLVMAGGEIDLSVGSVFAFTGMATGMLMAEGVPVYPAIGIALVGAALIGFVNGFLVVRFRVNSLMLTIGTMLVVRGLADVMASTLSGATFAKPFREVARIRVGDVNLWLVVLIVLTILFGVFERRHRIARRIFQIGESPETAVIYGVRAGALKLSLFVLSAVTAGIGGILAASRNTHADPKIGLGLEFLLVTAAIIGGASLSGGRGSVPGAVLGLLFLAVIVNGMVMFDVEPLIQQLVIGVLLVAAVSFDLLVRRWSGR